VRLDVADGERADRVKVAFLMTRVMVLRLAVLNLNNAIPASATMG
jgi:hypothetical protein